jgi:hypothetical protein
MISSDSKNDKLRLFERTGDNIRTVSPQVQHNTALQPPAVAHFVISSDSPSPSPSPDYHLNFIITTITNNKGAAILYSIIIITAIIIQIPVISSRYFPFNS